MTDYARLERLAYAAYRDALARFHITESEEDREAAAAALQEWRRTVETRVREQAA